MIKKGMFTRSKKDRKIALKRILGNRVIVFLLSTAMGCDGAMKLKERRCLVEDMIKSYREENYTDSLTVNFIGIGQKKNNKKSGLFGGFRDSSKDSYFTGKNSFDYDDISEEELKNYEVLKNITRK